MPKESRQLFVKYEQQHRGYNKATKRQILTEWLSFNQNLRDQIASAHRAILRGKDTASLLGEVCEERTNEGMAVRDLDPPGDPTEWHEAMAKALSAQQQYQQARVELRAAYQKLLAMQRNSYNAHHKSRDGTEDLIEEQGRQVGEMKKSIWGIKRMMDMQENVPEYPAGTPKMPYSWLAPGRYGRQREENRQEDRLQNDVGFRNPQPNSRHWQPWIQLMGGQGDDLSASWMWIQSDDNLRVRDRVVRKDVDGSGGWTDVRWWDGDTRDFTNRLPNELACHQQMWERTDTVVRPKRNVSGARGRRFVDDVTQKYRFYVAWCPHGSVADLIEDYEARHSRIPEPFIWSVAEALAECALAMEKGHGNDGQDEPIEDWKQIVHRDLKPDNIFLDATRQNVYPDYPEPKVGDWGLAFKTSPNDGVNPFWFQETGTEGFLAPEHKRFVHRDTLQSLGPKMLAHTNIWGIGIILYCLITNNVQPEQPTWLGDPANETMYDRANNHATYGHYSQALISIMLNCLDANVTQRRTPARLLRYIRHRLNVNGAALHWGMRDGTATAAAAHAQRLRFGADDYALGLTTDQLPAVGNFDPWAPEMPPRENDDGDEEDDEVD